METKPMTAWLIKWEWIGDHAKVQHPIVEIVSARKGTPYVMDYLQRLHDLYCLSLVERADIARYNRPRKRRPYEVKQHLTKRGLVIDVGHNPHLTARLVKNLVVKTDPETGEETVTFETEEIDAARLAMLRRIQEGESLNDT